MAQSRVGVSVVRAARVVRALRTRIRVCCAEAATYAQTDTPSVSLHLIRTELLNSADDNAYVALIISFLSFSLNAVLPVVWHFELSSVCVPVRVVSLHCNSYLC